MANLFDVDFGTFYKLNLLMQPKVIKTYIKIFRYDAGEKLSQLLSETLRFKSSLDICRVQGSSFSKCDRLRILNGTEQRGHYNRQLLGNVANRKKCDVSVGKVNV